jgi:hypothetical protein
MRPARNADDSLDVPGVGLGEIRATALGLAVALAVAVGEADVGGVGDVVALGVGDPAAPPRLTGGHVMTALAVMSPLASTAVEKQ